MEQRDVLVVLFDRLQSLDVTGPVEVFSGASAAAPGAYRIRTASLDGAPVRTSSGLTLTPDLALADAGAPDTLLIPGGEGTAPPIRGSSTGCTPTPTAPGARSRCAAGRCCWPRPGCWTAAA